MRLLNTRTVELSEFFGKDIPKYAILSHRWEEEEITFQDIQLVARGRERKKGWTKLEGCRRQALKDEFDWVWDDTCCIDKSSSAELSEAINSMFNWYRGAEVCYAYLSDVSAALGKVMVEFQGSKWFTRGWTLQELLAPKRLVFFDRQWVELGTREKLKTEISDATGIPTFHIKFFEGASVAQRMAWASNRETTRIEDMAYSLMGLFEVNMPPLYGEGERAFLRLQLEILRTSDDESIFAWKDRDDLTGSLLARSPAAFRDLDIWPIVSDLDKPYYLMTNKGLRMECHLLPARFGPVVEADDTFVLPLQCQNNEKERICILLQRVLGNVFVRITSGELVSLEDKESEAFRAHESELAQTHMAKEAGTRRLVYVRQSSNPQVVFPVPNTYHFRIPTEILELNGYALRTKYASGRKESHLWSIQPGKTCGVWINEVNPRGQIVVFEFTRMNIAPHTRLLVVISLYSHRPRLLVCAPSEDFSMAQDVISRSTLDGWRALWDFFTSIGHEKVSNYRLRMLSNGIRERTYEVGIAFESM
jgi:hypothetical protein